MLTAMKRTENCPCLMSIGIKLLTQFLVTNIDKQECRPTILYISHWLTVCYALLESRSSFEKFAGPTSDFEKLELVCVMYCSLRRF